MTTFIASDNRPVNIIIRYKDGTQKTVVGYGVDNICGLLQIDLASGETHTEDANDVKSILFHGRTVWTSKGVQ